MSPIGAPPISPFPQKGADNVSPAHVRTVLRTFRKALSANGLMAGIDVVTISNEAREKAATYDPAKPEGPGEAKSAR